MSFFNFLQNAFEVPRNKTHCTSSTSGTTQTVGGSRTCAACDFEGDNQQQLEILQQSNVVSSNLSTNQCNCNITVVSSGD